MNKKRKAAIIIPIVIVGLFVIGGLLSMPYINTNVEAISGVTQFYILEDGSLTKIRFSLIDNEGYVAASDANVSFVVTSESGRELYRDEFSVKASDFQQYQLQMTGQPIFAYAWQIPELIEADGDSLSLDTALLTVTLPNGKVFTAEQKIL